MKYTMFVMLLGLFISPFFVYADPVLRTGETVSIDQTQKVLGDFYGLGGMVTLSGGGEGDAYIGGGTVTVNGEIREDLSILGGTVQVHGKVGDDLRIIGGDVTVGEAITGDVVILGGVFTVLSTATIEGDLLFFGGEAIIEGDVKGTIHGTADKIRLNGEVGEEVLVVAPSGLILGDNADIMGDVTYESRNDLVRSQNARVGGDIRKTEIAPQIEQAFLETYLFMLAVLLFAGLSLYFIARKKIVTCVETTMENMPLSGLIGLGMFLTVPFIATLFFVSIIGGILGVALLLFYGLALILSIVLGGVLLGVLIERHIFKKERRTFITVCIGTFIFSILSFLPFLGGLLMFAIMMISLGGIGLMLYRGIRS